jgi:hypothetical protein
LFNWLVCEHRWGTGKGGGGKESLFSYSMVFMDYMFLPKVMFHSLIYFMFLTLCKKLAWFSFHFQIYYLLNCPINTIGE